MKKLHEFAGINVPRLSLPKAWASPMEALLKAKAKANSKLRPDLSTLNAANKLPDSYPQKRAAAKGIISREEIAALLREARLNKNLSADLKPALRELAARSEAIVEFALVRDADGRFVEVEEDGGMGLGGRAVRAGVGAAAIGAGGLGLYRADKAIMDKYGKRGLLENMDSRNLPSAYAGTNAAGTATATRGQAYRTAMKDIGNTATSRFNQGLAAGKQAYESAGLRATAAVKYPGFTLGRIGRALKKGLKIATRM